MVKPVKREPKKPYLSPLLTVYGTVEKLTQKNGITKSTDGGRAPRNRTHI